MCRKLQGSTEGGELEGKAEVKFWDKTMIIGYFKDGILHEFVRHFDKKGRLTFLGNHKNGKPDGTCSKIIRGGGCIVGRVDTAGELTGRDIVYIYPEYAFCETFYYFFHLLYICLFPDILYSPIPQLLFSFLLELLSLLCSRSELETTRAA